ncbi:MAG: phosphoribosylglycinamide formyltransferase [Marinifilaceae bacterium]
MKKIAIFASGSGSNAENIARYFENNTRISVEYLFCNNPKAYAIERAKHLEIPFKIFNREDFYENNSIIELLKDKKIDYIILAGFLWLIPNELVKLYPNRIINIHPALLPNYGGKGMYGSKVHKAVIDNKEKESGITIHFVNENYDEGNTIFQAKCSLDENDTSDTLADKIHILEQENFPRIIEQTIEKQL